MAPTDRDVLVALYEATGGPHWSNKTNWATDVDLSAWYGVTANDQGRVLKLDLSANNLRGPIPPELGNLAALQVLNLEENDLSGNIPPELVKLRALTVFSLRSNELTGTIPAVLGALSNLTELYLYGNELTGPIPPELGKLTALVELRLGNNQLSGEIPASLGQLSNLQTLDLHSNALSGPIPPKLGNLAALQYLQLQDNKLSGAIPAQLGALNKLKWLDLSDNQLNGTIPAALGALSNLTRLSLSENELTGSIPPQLGKLAALELLRLEDNQLSGPNPPSNFVDNPEEVLRWVQIRHGQSEDLVHSHASRVVGVLTSLWHFSLPVLDDVTDVWLLWVTFGGSHRGLWWTCLCVFAIADIERAYTAFFFVALLLSLILYVVSCGCIDFSDVGMSFLAGQHLDLSKPWYLLVDSLLWTLFGSRARSSPFMRSFGLAGDSSGQALQETGLGVHAIDVMMFYHPFRYFGELVMSFPRGHRRDEVAMPNVAHRRKISMVRAVGETLWVDPLFLALSVVTGGWDENAAGLVILSALFSLLELVTELQYYVTEAEDANPSSNIIVGDVEVGVGGSENPDPRPTELPGPISFLKK